MDIKRLIEIHDEAEAMTTKDYPLDFFEAMAALKEGKIVENNYYKNTPYSFNKGTGLIMMANSTCVNFNSHELHAAWCIVEPEKKCWLELTIENFGFSSRGQKSVYMALGKELAHEAIKRIESDCAKTQDLIAKAAYKKSILTLKELIGESK